jgi:WD40 repeat protein
MSIVSHKHGVALSRALSCYRWSFEAQSQFMVSGSADNTLRLWAVSTGKCLFTWEFPTAVKSVAFSEDDERVVCITEQRMGFQCAIRVFDINREGDGTKRQLPSSSRSALVFYICADLSRVGRANASLQSCRIESDCVRVHVCARDHRHGPRVRQGRAVRLPQWG